MDPRRRGQGPGGGAVGVASERRRDYAPGEWPESRRPFRLAGSPTTGPVSIGCFLLYFSGSGCETN